MSVIWVMVGLVWLASSAGFLAGVIWHAHRTDAEPPPLPPDPWISRMRSGIVPSSFRN